MLRGRILCALSASVFVGLMFLSGCSCSSESNDVGTVAEEIAAEADAASTKSVDDENDTQENDSSSDDAFDKTDESDAQSNSSTDGVLATMDEITAPILERDVNTISGYFEDIFFDPTIYGISSEEFIDAFFDGFSCEVVEINNLADGTAEVSLHMVTRDGQQAVDELTDAYQKMLSTGEAIDCKQVMEKVDTFEFDDPYYFEAYLAKNSNDIWELKDKAAFGTALLGGYDPRQLAD